VRVSRCFEKLKLRKRNKNYFIFFKKEWVGGGEEFNFRKSTCNNRRKSLFWEKIKKKKISDGCVSSSSSPQRVSIFPRFLYIYIFFCSQDQPQKTLSSTTKRDGQEREMYHWIPCDHHPHRHTSVELFIFFFFLFLFFFKRFLFSCVHFLLASYFLFSFFFILSPERSDCNFL
jgi:hypothetical protein